MISQKISRVNFKTTRLAYLNACRYCTDNEKKQHWRTPWKERPGEWRSTLSLFTTGRGPSTEYLRFVQTDIDLRPSSIMRWWKKIRTKIEIIEERYIPERHQILGPDLAAAHFIVHRNGAVRFLGREDWVRQNDDEEYELPKFYDPSYCVEAIDASKMTLHFEGLINLLELKRLKWISFEGCPNIDDWCLDRISGGFQDTLEYLDIRNCPKITANGLVALYRMSNLKKLLVSNPASDKNLELMCLLLEDIHPMLEIEGITYLSEKEGVGSREGTG